MSQAAPERAAAQAGVGWAEEGTRQLRRTTTRARASPTTTHRVCKSLERFVELAPQRALPGFLLELVRVVHGPVPAVQGGRRFDHIGVELQRRADTSPVRDRSASVRARRRRLADARARPERSRTWMSRVRFLFTRMGFLRWKWMRTMCSLWQGW